MLNSQIEMQCYIWSNYTNALTLLERPEKTLRVFEVRGDHTPPAHPKQGQLEQADESCVQQSFEYLRTPQLHVLGMYSVILQILVCPWRLCRAVTQK